MTFREIVERSNATCKRLVREEDGVVLGVMVVTLMSLFLTASAVFAVGEHIRDRIEIQNAVDAAAYSAAVVQADTISRIAAINQAMAWTYIQMCRRHMDYILGKWMGRVCEEYKSDRNYLKGKYGTYEYLRNYDLLVDSNPEIHINKSIYVSYNDISSKYALWKSRESDVCSGIVTNRNDLVYMKIAEDDLVSAMPRRIEECAQEVLRRNLGDTARDRIIIKIGRNNAGKIGDDLFEAYDTETKFLGTILDSGQTGASVLGDGSGDDQWFPDNKSSSQPWRSYIQKANMLIAEWQGYTSGYRYRERIDGTYYYYEYGHFPKKGVVKGIDVTSDLIKKKDPYVTVRKIYPRRLKQRYFEDGGGGIVVACARPLRHPFKLFIDGGGAGGFYDAFKEGAGNNPRYMMAVSAARAGYRDGSEGEYNPCNHMRSSGGSFYNSTKNLGQTDWDAVLIPIRRAWAEWASDSGASVLQELWEGNRWESLNGDWTGSLQGQGQLPGAERTARPIKTGFGKTPAELSKSLYH